jgi:prepilin-type N-terminal cleavage/methylation domain-containing protein
VLDLRSRIQSVRSDESGFTLVELLAAMVIGMIVLMAAFLLLDRATSASTEIADRQEAVQRGRMAMERITRQLRSQVCLGDETEPITYGDDNQIVFYTDLGAGSLNGDSIEQRRLSFVEAAGTARIVQDIFGRTGGSYPDLTFSTLPTQSEVLMYKASRLLDDGVNRPFLRYYGFVLEDGEPGELERLSTPLSPDDASRTVMVRVGFAALPDRKNPNDRLATGMETDVYVRLADPSKPLEGPRCL